MKTFRTVVSSQDGLDLSSLAATANAAASSHMLYIYVHHVSLACKHAVMCYMALNTLSTVGANGSGVEDEDMNVFKVKAIHSGVVATDINLQVDLQERWWDHERSARP